MQGGMILKSRWNAIWKCTKGVAEVTKLLTSPACENSSPGDICLDTQVGHWICGRHGHLQMDERKHVCVCVEISCNL